MQSRFPSPTLLLTVLLMLLAHITAVNPVPAQVATQQQFPRTPVPVVTVVDGDTIKVRYNDEDRPVRYLGIDAPERGDMFGQEATEANRSLVEGKLILLEADVADNDPRGRWLRYVFLPTPDLFTIETFVEEELVRLGLASVLVISPNNRYAERLTQAQATARASKVGIWSIPRFHIFLPYLRNRCINLNTASFVELTWIKHIGDVLAAEIIAMRPWQSVDDLLRLRGISDHRLQEIKAEGLACVNTL